MSRLRDTQIPLARDLQSNSATSRKVATAGIAVSNFSEESSSFIHVSSISGIYSRIVREQVREYASMYVHVFMCVDTYVSIKIKILTRPRSQTPRQIESANRYGRPTGRPLWRALP